MTTPNYQTMSHSELVEELERRDSGESLNATQKAVARLKREEIARLWNDVDVLEGNPAAQARAFDTATIGSANIQQQKPFQTPTPQEIAAKQAIHEREMKLAALQLQGQSQGQANQANPNPNPTPSPANVSIAQTLAGQSNPSAPPSAPAPEK